MRLLAKLITLAGMLATVAWFLWNPEGWEFQWEPIVVFLFSFAGFVAAEISGAEPRSERPADVEKPVSERPANTDAADEKKRKRKLIAAWRDMILEIQNSIAYENEVNEALQLHPSFLTLEPYLSEDARRAVYGENRTIVVGNALSAPLITLKAEITRLEKEWDLQ